MACRWLTVNIFLMNHGYMACMRTYDAPAPQRMTALDIGHGLSEFGKGCRIMSRERDVPMRLGTRGVTCVRGSTPFSVGDLKIPGFAGRLSFDDCNPGAPGHYFQHVFNTTRYMFQRILNRYKTEIRTGPIPNRDEQTFAAFPNHGLAARTTALPPASPPPDGSRAEFPKPPLESGRVKPLQRRFRGGSQFMTIRTFFANSSASNGLTRYPEAPFLVASMILSFSLLVVAMMKGIPECL